MNRLPPLAVLLLFAVACGESSDNPMEAVPGTAEAVASRINSSADAGPGSFRQAVLDANADPSIGIIRFEGGLDPIKLTTPVTYSGSQDLVIRAGGAVLDGKQLGADESAFVDDGGGNLTISRLGVSRAPGNGITVKVPDDATGTFHVRLEEVVIRNNGLHGILINDQVEYFNDPASTSEEGSAAGLLVEVVRSRFERNGFSLIDSDGLRINEGGPGTLAARLRDTRFANNGADGLELDERGDGDSDFSLQGTSLIGNGSFTTEDLDDGIDVDEGGEGDLIGRFNDVLASRNFARLVEAVSVDNRMTSDEESIDGILLQEDETGDLTADLVQATARRNSGDGIQLEENEDGDLDGRIRRSTASGNGGAGADLAQVEPGAGSVEFTEFTAPGNADGPIAAEGVTTSGAP